MTWDWEKIDYGVRLGLYPGLDLTCEFSDNTFVVKGVDYTNDEFLLTLRWNWDRGFGQSR